LTWACKGRAVAARKRNERRNRLNELNELKKLLALQRGKRGGWGQAPEEDELKVGQACLRGIAAGEARRP